LKSKSFAVVFSSLVVGMLVLSACPPKKKLAIEEKKVEEKKVEEVDKSSDTVNTVDKANEIRIAQDWTEIPALEMIHFGLDSANLDDTARVLLKKNVAILKKLPITVLARVEGHCDSRGTVEYNIALGQRRANAVRSYYVTAGIPRNRLETISFGEERPLCTQETEACWAQNRRAVTKVRNSQPITVNPSDLQ
jgi:peptidoglycan-associated lipoprotein